ncbi:MAG TPA: hypothetical protein VK121_08545 [Pseudogracilibacillus sp.]|nr:hypothetical protein [Pseudogracilibacillus sp.]
MTVESITLSEAYMIENLRKQGISNESLLKVDDASVERWKDLDDRFDFNVLKEMAFKEQEKYKSVIKDGYQVKFLTINGLINLVELKFNKQKEVDFKVLEDGISELVLDKAMIPLLKEFLSVNWKVIETGDYLAVRSINAL